MLNYIGALVLNGINGEILGDLYKVSLKEICESCKLSCCNVSFVVAFAAKIVFFSKVALSNYQQH